MDLVVLVLLCMAPVFAAAAIAVLFFAQAEAKLFCLALAAISVLCLTQALQRAYELTPRDPPPRAHTITVSCPP